MIQINPIWFVPKYFSDFADTAESRDRSTAQAWAAESRVDFHAPELSPADTYEKLQEAIALHEGSPINLVMQTNAYGIYSVLKFLQTLIRDFPKKIANVFLAVNTKSDSIDGLGAANIQPLDRTRLLALPLDADREFLGGNNAETLALTPEFLQSNQADKLGLWISKSALMRQIFGDGGAATKVFLDGVKAALAKAPASSPS